VYLEWHLNIDYQELESFTEKTQIELALGHQPPLPVISSIAPAPLLRIPSSGVAPSYRDGVAAGTPLAGAGVVVPGAQTSGGILGAASGVVPTSTNPKVMAAL